MLPHIVPKTVYFKVAGALAVLLLLTVVIAEVDLGYFNTPLALAIAVAKAVLIILFFMNVRQGSPLLKIFAAAGFLWLGIMLMLTMADVLSRS
jgi:cytochrome c oxidase subunit 4